MLSRPFRKFSLRLKAGVSILPERNVTTKQKICQEILFAPDGLMLPVPNDGDHEWAGYANTRTLHKGSAYRFAR